MTPLRSAAILIGFDGYPPAATVEPLSGAINDCMAVATLLTGRQLVRKEDIHAHLYSKDQAITIPAGWQPLVLAEHVPKNGNAGSATILQAYSALIQRLARDGFERLYVYVSGHGGDFATSMPPVSALICSDYVGGQGRYNYGLLVIDALHDAIHSVGTFKEAVLIADCCRSTLPLLTGVPNLGPAPLWNTGLRCLTLKSTVFNTPSIEREFEVEGKSVVYGVFTQALIEAIKRELDRSAHPTWREVCDAVDKAGHAIEYHQVTSYPLLQVEPAALAPPLDSPISHWIRARPTGPKPIVKGIDDVAPAGDRTLETILASRTLINGIRMLDQELHYLNDDEREYLDAAQELLRHGGRAGAVKPGKEELESILAFLTDQANQADPLSLQEATARADGFVMTVEDLQVEGKRATMQMVVRRPDSSEAPGVRFYLHPTFFPPILDVPFQENEASLTLDIWGGFTALAQVEDGPALKLDLSREPSIPVDIREN